MVEHDERPLTASPSTTQIAPDEPTTDLPDRDRGGRIVIRFVVAVAIGAGVALAGWVGSSHSLTGHFDVVGYPLYADFDVNRYFDAFYLIAVVFPAVALATYAIAGRFGPLRRRASRRRAPLTADTEEGASEPTTSVGRWGRVVVVGAILGYAIGSGASGDPVGTTLGVGAAWTLGVALVVAIVRHRIPSATGPVRSVVNALGVVALIGLGARIAGRAGVTVTSTGHTEHFAIFPIQIALVATVIALGVLVWRVRRGGAVEGDVDQSFVRYLAVPFAIFLAFSYIPGDLGKMDTFGEGEYLAAGTRILNGALPWRDLWLIHGLLDDGLKALVGFAIFGMSRWGATAGITAILTPAYFVTSYLFAAYFLRRSWALVAAGAIAFSCGVFVDWDIRFLLLPLVLIALTSTLRHRTIGRGVVLGFALIAQAVLVPELTLAVPPLAGIVIIADLYRARGTRRSLGAFRTTFGVGVGLAATGAVFSVYLLATHSFRGFVDYYRNFADAHSLTGGIPLFVNYAIYGPADRFGVHHFDTVPTGITTRYAIELVLPLIAILLVTWLTAATVRGGRRLSPDDFAMIAMAGVVLLYFQKSISRGDLAHIGEVFSVSTPLIVVLAARLTGSIDHLAHSALDAWAQRAAALNSAPRRVADSIRRTTRPRAVGSLALLVAVAVAAPVSVGAIVRDTPGHLLTTVAAPAPKPYVAGGPSLGFAQPGALPTGLVTNLDRIFTAEAGPHGSVFDLSDAPGIVDFFLERNPASRFYDISLAITPSAQRLVVADIAKNRPRVVLFSGVSGLSSWDYIANDVRQYIVSDYVLNHYRPLVYTTGELVFVADDVTPAPLPKLVGNPSITQLYFSQGTCALGYIPDFLDSPKVPSSTTTVPLTPIATRGKGRLFRIDLPAGRHTYEWLALSRSGSGPAGITVGNIVRNSGADVPWHDITWVANAATTVVSVGSCLQWHGFGPTAYLRYEGPGTPTSVRLFNS